MRGTYERLVDYFDRHPALVPLAVALSAILFATTFASTAVYFDLHHDGRLVISLAIIISVALSAPAAYIQYSREARIQAQKEALNSLASTDALTGTMNRRSFGKAVRDEQARMARSGANAALILFDLDWFKKVNDTFGHEAGDRVLVAVSEVAWAELRNPLDYLARWGGEEFAIFLNGVSADRAEVAAERLRQAIEALNVETDGTAIKVTASFGVAELTYSCTIDDAIRRADRALYYAKHSGRNRTISYSKLESADTSGGQAA
ncbi:MAG: GGDEF domain-containing protein [Pseudomonadota bacterium]